MSKAAACVVFVCVLAARALGQEPIGPIPLTPTAPPDDVPVYERRLANSRVVETKRYWIEHTTSVRDARNLAVRMEAYYKVLDKIFGPFIPPKRRVRLTVRYIKDAAEFKAYGRTHCRNFSEGWTGYYYYGTRASKCEMIVLLTRNNDYSIAYHEGFHQFLHMAVRNVFHLPAWFNEGLATYYGHGTFRGGRFFIPKAMNTGRARYVRNLVRKNATVPWSVMFSLTTSSWNGPNQTTNYNQAYSMVHLLMAHPQLRGAFLSFMRELVKTGDHDHALKTGFAKISLERAEEIWKTYAR